MNKMNVVAAVVGDEASARQQLLDEAVDIFYCDLASISSFVQFQKDFPKKALVLLLTDEIEKHFADLLNYSQVKYIVSCAGFDDGTCQRAFIASSNKIRESHFFGFDKYFVDEPPNLTLKVCDSRQRHDLKDQMMEELKNSGVRSSIADRMYTVAEELLMNAIYDAPVDENGQSLYNHKSRKEEVHLSVPHQSEFNIVVSKKMAGVSVVDPFGALPSDLIVKYLKSCYEGTAGSMNQNKGGAGRGLHQIIENSDVTIFNVSPQKKTEVICLFSLERPGTLPPPTFHYFRE